MPTWTPVANLSSFRDTPHSPSVDTFRFNRSMDEQKAESRRRRRRRSGDSSPQSPAADNTSVTRGRGSSAPWRSGRPVLTPSEQHRAPLSLISGNPGHVPTSRSAGPSPHDTQRHTGKRRASGDMVHREEESKTVQPATPQGTPGSEIRRPDLPERPVVSPMAAVDASTGRESLEQTPRHAPHTSAASERPTSTLPSRVSTRRTTTTTRWSPSMAGGREQDSRPGPHRAARAQSSRSPGSVVAPPVRPISNATRNINFDMLQPYFERPLQQAADSFGVCTTLLKKICRRNGISNWPYRKICGLRKSIASMAKQVNYFDGEQKRAYADQLEKLEHELQAFLHTGNEPTPEFLQLLQSEAVHAPALAQSHQDVQTAAGIANEDEEKEAQEVPAWTTRPSIAPPQYSIQSPHALQTTPRQAPPGGMPSTWPLQTQAFPTIATHHRALPSIASILQHQSYSSPSRAASTQDTGAAPSAVHFDADSRQQQQWRYFPPPNDDHGE